jgi:rod shape-determining protein MreD
MAIWTLAFLLLDLVDSRVGWRDYWLDWLFAALLILAHTAGGWYIARLMGSVTLFEVMVPQIVLSIFTYPLVARLIVALDRWRLAR